MQNDGTFTYTSAPNWDGSDSFTALVRDGSGASASAVVSLSIASVNDAPSALPARLTVLGGMSGEVPVQGFDIENDALTFALSNPPANGSASVVKVGTQWIAHYQSKVGFSGTDTLSVVARDGRLNSAPATITVTVTVTALPNSAPQLVSLAPKGGSFVPGSTVVFEQKVRDANGAANLDAIALLIGNSPGTANARGGATLWFDAVTNRFTLTQEDRANTFAPVALENTQVTVALDATDVLREGNGTLTLRWRVTFKPAFTGTKSVWMHAKDLGGLSAGFTKIGDIKLENLPPHKGTSDASAAAS